MQKKILLALIALTFAFAPATAERIKHEDKIIEAITLMDEGKYAPSIRILRDVLATDSTNYHARYELGYAYYLAGNYRQSAAMYEPLVDYPEANDQTFSMLGNALDMAGDRKRALDVYYDGIKRFPKSGKLHVELGTMALIDGDSKTAMACYLRAVKVAPDYTPGFYRTAMLLFNSDRPELALCYGEMFLAKESENKSRIEAVSKGIVDTYRSIVRVDGDTLTTHFPATNITLSTNSTAADLEREFLRFDVIYGVDFDFAAKSLGKVAAFDAETICRLRTAIADQLLNNELIADSKNPYLRHLKAVRESGCENAYNHYVVLYGDQPADYEIEFDDALSMFRAGLARDPSGDALRYFDGVVSRRELDELSDALASGLLANGFSRGDRLAVYLQNVPQFVIAMVAAWKAGGIMVSINPMSRAR